MTNCGKTVRMGQPWLCTLPLDHEGECISNTAKPGHKNPGLRFWYRCQMCSPNQSKYFDINSRNIDVLQAYRLVKEEHDRENPKCPATKTEFENGATVEMLVRLVQ